jgi:hypothetical protein
MNTPKIAATHATLTHTEGDSTFATDGVTNMWKKGLLKCKIKMKMRMNYAISNF